MDEDRWTQVDRYIEARLIEPDEAARALLAANAAAGLPAIDVSPAQGRLLQMLAMMAGARSVLEIGTLGGYSTLWLSRGVPRDGRIVTIEVDPATATVAQANFERAGIARVVELRVGAALEVLPQIEGPFDLVFIDADKANNARYAEWALKLARPGAVIVCDNVVREGRVLDAAGADPAILGTRALFELLGRDRDVTATAIQTVGRKGWDGFAIALVSETRTAP